MKDKIKTSYKQSKNIYDDVLTQSKWWSKLYIRLFWSGVDDNEIAERILAYIPDEFEGELLDVPVGTAVFTGDKYARMKSAKITCLDYSEDMLEQARARFQRKGIENAKVLQGDVGNLPFADETYDIVLSMNGFHAFPDKERAFKETWRVLKPGGEFIACFYIKGKSGITDWLVKWVLAPKGWFTPPFQTEAELKEILEKLYPQMQICVDGSMVYFRCIK